MTHERFRIGVLILGFLSIFVFYLYAENGKYQIISAALPTGWGWSTKDGEARVIEERTVIRINTRTGFAEYYYDLSNLSGVSLKGELPKEKNSWNHQIKRGWTSLTDEEYKL